MVVKKQDGSTGSIGNTKLPKWLDDMVTNKWFIPLVLILLVVGGIYASPIGVAISKTFASTPTTNSIPAPNTHPVGGPQIVVTTTPGLATPSLNTGQEVQSPSNQWYSISAKEYRIGEKFQYKGINFIIQVAPNGRETYILISSEDSQKLINSEQTLLIKIKFRIKGTNKVSETPVESFSGIMAPFMKGWTETLGDKAKNLLPSDIEWQPEFGKKNKFND